MGWPISILAPGISESFSRISRTISPRVRSLSVYGASISETLTPNECSSNSARPVLRAVVRTSGTDSINFSASAPILSLSSSDIPGRVEILMVIEPSLKDGRKLRPRVKNNAIAATNRTPTPVSTARECLRHHSRAAVYPVRILRVTYGSRSALAVAFLDPSK